ncbi:MAG: hypothetical protein AAB738_02805 [Patescibacteria group bacterium]
MIPNILILQKEKRRDGQALVEAIVALSVLMVGFVAMLSLLNNSLATTNMVSDQDIATYLATEGIEVVINLINTDTTNFDPNPGSYEVSADQKLEPDADSDNKDPGLPIGGPNKRSETPLNFNSLTKSYTYTNDANTIPTRFYRTIVIKPAMNQLHVHVISIVEWKTKGGGSPTVQLDDVFFL